MAHRPSDVYGARAIECALGVIILFAILVSFEQGWSYVQEGEKVDLGTVGLGMRLLREGLILILTVIASAIVIIRGYASTAACFILASVFGLLAAFIWHSLFIVNVPLVAMAALVKLMQLAVWATIFYSISRAGHRDLRFLLVAILIGLAAQIVFSAFQYFVGTSLSWARTAMGTKVFGTFANYNVLAAYCVTTLVLIMYGLRERWCLGKTRSVLWIAAGLATLLVLLTASRGGILSAAAAWTMYISSAKVKFGAKSVRLSAIGLILAGLVVPLVYVAVSSKQFTGRDVDAFSEQRTAIWVGYVNELQTSAEVLFGKGAGRYTNTYRSLAKGGVAEGTDPSLKGIHSGYVFLLVNFGAIILFIALIAGGLTFLVATSTGRIAVVVAAILAIPYSIFEFYPVNFLLAGMLGFELGRRSFRIKQGIRYREVLS